MRDKLFHFFQQLISFSPEGLKLLRLSFVHKMLTNINYTVVKVIAFIIININKDKNVIGF